MQLEGSVFYFDFGFAALLFLGTAFLSVLREKSSLEAEFVLLVVLFINRRAHASIRIRAGSVRLWRETPERRVWQQAGRAKTRLPWLFLA